MDLDGFSASAEIFNDIFYALIIGFFILKFRVRGKKLNPEIMKFKIQLALGLLALAAGCATHDEKIAFTDDAAVRVAAAGAVVQPAQKKLDKADDLKIEQLIFGYLLEMHFWDMPDYSAVFLQG